MNLFKIFERKKTIRIKDIFSNVLDEMWMCAFDHNPWDQGDFKVTVHKVCIVAAKATTDGIWVTSDETIPGWDTRKYAGYIDRITEQCGWVGFFETEEKAKAAYNALMDEWSGKMLASKFGDEKKGEPHA